MTIATTTTTCPEWCTIDHSKVLKFGGDLTDIEGHDGPSWSSVPSMDANEQGWNTHQSVEIAAGCTEAGAMCVWLSAEGLQLTPKRAREVASTLVAAADWAEAHHA